MKRMAKLFCVLLTLTLWAGSALAADVALTTVGQSPDAVMVKVILKRLGINPLYEPLLQPENLGGEKVLVAVVGGSSKGLGAAGIDADQEKARAVALLDAARSKNMHILVMHVGGEGRRGTLSDAFIEVVVPYGERLILVKGANGDGLFTKLAGKDVPIVEAENVAATQGPLSEVLKSWNIMK